VSSGGEGPGEGVVWRKMAEERDRRAYNSNQQVAGLKDDKSGSNYGPDTRVSYRARRSEYS